MATGVGLPVLFLRAFGVVLLPLIDDLKRL
jgi:hypothetical protein